MTEKQIKREKCESIRQEASKTWEKGESLCYRKLEKENWVLGVTNPEKREKGE